MVTEVAKGLSRIENRWRNCDRCLLHKSRTNVVFWSGNSDARLVVIGEAPGAREDEQGKPFVGQAGELFDELSDSVKGPEPWDVLICNCLGCRPPSNRKPFPEELQCCRNRLYAMLAIVQPKALLLLGGTALEFLTGVHGIMKARGQVLKATTHWKKRELEWKAVATLHPAYLLRNRDKRLRRLVASDIRTAWELAQPSSYLEGD